MDDESPTYESPIESKKVGYLLAFAVIIKSICEKNLEKMIFPSKKSIEKLLKMFIKCTTNFVLHRDIDSHGGSFLVSRNFL